MNRGLLLIGIGFVLVGLAWPWVSQIPWGRFRATCRSNGSISAFTFR